MATGNPLAWSQTAGTIGRRYIRPSYQLGNSTTTVAEFPLFSSVPLLEVAVPHEDAVRCRGCPRAICRPFAGRRCTELHQRREAVHHHVLRGLPWGKGDEGGCEPPLGGVD